MPQLQITLARPTDGLVVTGTLPISDEEAGRLLTVTTSPGPGVEIAASVHIDEDDAAGLLDVLVDLTHATTGTSGRDPDIPRNLAPDGDDLTDEQLAVLNGETA